MKKMKVSEMDTTMDGQTEIPNAKRNIGAIVLVFLLFQAILFGFLQFRQNVVFLWAGFSTLMALLLGFQLWMLARYQALRDRLESVVIERNREIEDRQRVADKLIENESKLKAISEVCLDAVVMVDTEDRITFWNYAAEKMFGYERDEIIGKPLHDTLAPQRLRQRAKEAMRRFASTGEAGTVGRLMELRALRKDHTEFPIEIVTQSIRVQNQWWGVATVRDITDKKQTEEKLVELSVRDILTGLFNRHHFLTIAIREFNRAKRHELPLAMMVMDIDRFKSINDMHGYDAGDRVLKTLAGILSNSYRNTDFCARLGGGKLAVLLCDPVFEKVIAAAERLQESVANTIIPHTRKTTLRFTISIGIGGFSSDMPDVDALLKKGETALKRAKEKGKNCLVTLLPETTAVENTDAAAPVSEHGAN